MQLIAITCRSDYRKIAISGATAINIKVSLFWNATRALNWINLQELFIRHRFAVELGCSWQFHKCMLSRYIAAVPSTRETLSQKMKFYSEI